MTLLGRLLNNRRAGETHTAWNLPNLQGPELMALTSQRFGDGDTLPLECCAKNIGGDDLSPHLAWSAPPPGTAQLLLAVEDIDVPLTKPAVHCLALIDPAIDHLGPGALAARNPATGVQVLRSTIGRGYHGPGPIKGHGPHRYTFQLFALSTPVDSAPGAMPVDRARPRALLPAITARVLDRGRLTGVYER
ncbi:YbhB/YbcL family Raf kinase inhibitor-like protein [Streptomyces sp. NBC_00963]|uniref:YbhB/YbcL family Raf kinase inhibitor-like protein n=1 Tax=unclassified Streptomyces TaxID=2593676 RepID=UPI0022513638|nr:YbhB/YbcL family Raf kinase inhibitor-like protein [Streptomyces sp. NBC_01306]MCX4722565.1 YbhB/YbcL family Raf kinase inhibitor-like protein [Streptomyces sp. NBC_01306]WSX45877.1 YbhB/YbcL family Raf kinase inhibitor-like protein [Streptomyces sp. NBC_00963]WSX66055.1 YbhB/YbcL family Raf kinase inhibitor-like protein [Streptomyces sp. NBC_00932]